VLIQLYILALVLSAILLVASLLVGDTATDVAADHEVEPTIPSEVGQLDGLEKAPGRFVVSNLKSIRFWTFFAAFFGIAGLLLDGLDLMGPVTALLAAIGTGLLTGLGINAAVRIFSS